jgi:hypothetical protein
MRIAIVAAVAASGLLAACSSGPRVESSTTDVVTVSYFEGQGSSAEAKAREECNRYGKRTRFRTTTGGNTGERLGIYDCLPP